MSAFPLGRGAVCVHPSGDISNTVLILEAQLNITGSQETVEVCFCIPAEPLGFWTPFLSSLAGGEYRVWACLPLPLPPATDKMEELLQFGRFFYCPADL